MIYPKNEKIDFTVTLAKVGLFSQSIRYVKVNSFNLKTNSPLIIFQMQRYKNSDDIGYTVYEGNLTKRSEPEPQWSLTWAGKAAITTTGITIGLVGAWYSWKKFY